LKKLVILQKLDETSKQTWPSLGYFIGSFGTVEGEGEETYQVRFDPSIGLSDQSMLEWKCLKTEVDHYVFQVATKAVFRANPTDIPVVGTIIWSDVGEDGNNTYDYVTVDDNGNAATMSKVPEMFFRPYLGK